MTKDVIFNSCKDILSMTLLPSTATCDKTEKCNLVFFGCNKKQRR